MKFIEIGEDFLSEFLSKFNKEIKLVLNDFAEKKINLDAFKTKIRSYCEELSQVTEMPTKPIRNFFSILSVNTSSKDFIERINEIIGPNDSFWDEIISGNSNDSEK